MITPKVHYRTHIHLFSILRGTISQVSNLRHGGLRDGTAHFGCRVVTDLVGMMMMMMIGLCRRSTMLWP